MGSSSSSNSGAFAEGQGEGDTRALAAGEGVRIFGAGSRPPSPYTMRSARPLSQRPGG